MKKLTSSTAILLAIATVGLSQAPKGIPGQTKRYLYISTPDAAQEIYKAGAPGILIFDIDDGHKFVRRIPVPEFKEGLRGFANIFVVLQLLQGHGQTACCAEKRLHERMARYHIGSQDTVNEKPNVPPRGAERDAGLQPTSFAPTTWSRSQQSGRMATHQDIACGSESTSKWPSRWERPNREIRSPNG